jgi:hypothetical protein
VKIEISIDCIDETHRIPKGQTILWEIKSDGKDLSRDVRMRKLGAVILKALRSEYPSHLKRKKMTTDIEELTNQLSLEDIKSYCDDEEYIVGALARQLLASMKREAKLKGALEYISCIETPAEIPLEAVQWRVTSQQQSDAAYDVLKEAYASEYPVGEIKE